MKKFLDLSRGCGLFAASAAGVGLFAAGVCSAAEVTIKVEGRVIDVRDDLGLFGGVQLGDTGHARFAYDPTQAVAFEPPLNIGLLQVSKVAADVSGIAYEPIDTQAQLIDDQITFFGAPITFDDRVVVSGSIPSPDGAIDGDFRLDFVGNGLVPTGTPNPAAFDLALLDQAFFSFTFGQISEANPDELTVLLTSVTLEVTAIIVEPSPRVNGKPGPVGGNMLPNGRKVGSAGR